MKQFELALIRYDSKGEKVKTVDKIEGDDLVDILMQLNGIILQAIHRMRQEPDLPDNDEIYLLLNKTEAIAFANCPFTNINACENNYPGYNDVLNKIIKFARS